MQQIGGPAPISWTTTDWPGATWTRIGPSSGQTICGIVAPQLTGPGGTRDRLAAVPVFLVAPTQIADSGEVELRGGDAWHLARVLRCVPGEVITVVAEPGLEHEVRLLQLQPSRVVGVIVASRRARREPRTRLHLLQALPKGTGTAAVVEQLAQLGVTAVWPVLTRRTVTRPSPAAAADRLERWRGIARESAQLAGRHRVLQVEGLQPVRDAVAELQRREAGLQLFVCHEGERRQALASVTWDPARPTAVVIGPEGGLELDEVQALVEIGGRPTSLGPRNLRTTLAGVVAATVLLARAQDLEAPAG